MDDTSIHAVRNNGRTEFVSTLQMLTVNSKFSAGSNMQIHYCFQMTDLQVNNSQEKLILLESVTLNSKVVAMLTETIKWLLLLFQLVSGVVDVNLKLNTLLVTYNHDTIHEWVRNNFLRTRTMHSAALAASETFCNGDKVPLLNANSLLDKLSMRLVINGCAEFCHVLILLKLTGNSSHVGFNNVKVKLEQVMETRGE